MKRLLLCIALLLGIPPAFGAVTPNSAVLPQTPNRGVLQFTSSSTAGTYLTLYTAGANGSRCNAMFMGNTDTVTHLVTVQLVNSSTKYVFTALTTVAGAGFNGTSGNPIQPLMSATLTPGLPVDAFGNQYIQLISGDTIQVTFATAITSGDFVTLYVSCSDF